MAITRSRTLELELEDNAELCSIARTAANFEKIDEFAAETQDALQEIDEPTFAAPQTLSVPQSGESCETIFGKLKKAVQILLGHRNAAGSHDEATQSAAGYMSAADKAKLDGIETGATNCYYEHPAFDAHASGIYKLTINAEGHVAAATPIAPADLQEIGCVYPDPADYKYFDMTEQVILFPAGVRKQTVNVTFSNIPADAAQIVAVGVLNLEGSTFSNTRTARSVILEWTNGNQAGFCITMHGADNSIQYQRQCRFTAFAATK